MSDIGHNGGPSMEVLGNSAQRQLLSVFERMERLAEDRKAIMDDMKEVMAEAKGNGFDTAIIREVLKLRAMDPAKRQEKEALIDLYWTASGQAPPFEPAAPSPPADDHSDLG